MVDVIFEVYKLVEVFLWWKFMMNIFLGVVWEVFGNMVKVIDLMLVKVDLEIFYDEEI